LTTTTAHNFISKSTKQSIQAPEPIMLNHFTPYDYFQPVDPYASYIREQEARRQDERRRSFQQQQRRSGSRVFHFEDNDEFENEGLEVETSPNRDRFYDKEEPISRLVRGMDGRLYRIPVKQTAPSTEPVQYALVRGRDGRIYRVPAVGDRNGTKSGKKTATAQSATEGQHRSVPKATEPAVETQRSLPIATDVSNVEYANNSSVPMKPRNQPKATRQEYTKKATVIVEDASDSETENDERRSVWRNRLPSPGEWMEPVEGLAGI
jgi:hypothetical protein